MGLFLKKAIKQRVYKIIWTEYQKGVTDFYVNCEYGVPLWSAEIICELKSSYEIGLHIVVPYENQAVDWVEEIRNRYYFVHEHSDGVDFARFDYQPNCYNIADRIMANKSNRLLVFGGEKDNYSILEYAQEKGVNTKLFEEFY